MKFFAVLALATSALATMAPQADMDATNMAMNEQAQPAAAAPQADAAAQPQGWFPPPPPPPPRPQECRPGTYSCTVTKNGWRVCDVSGHWVFGGYCSRNTECKFNWQNGSPYCVPRY